MVDNLEEQVNAPNTDRKAGEPEKIVVLGAGLAEVNGEYHFAGRADETRWQKTDSPMYEMKGKWNNKDATFSIGLGYWSLCWFISVDGVTTTRPGKRLYCCHNVPNVNDPPPSRFWLHFGPESGSVAMCPPVLLYEGGTQFDWRQDPGESFADYKIKTTVENTGVSTDYHVHKLIIACGSDYFRRLMSPNDQSGYSFVEGNENTSHIQLTQLTAAVFPHMLDCLYWLFNKQERTIPICSSSPETQVGLYWLANYFEIRLLLHEMELHFQAERDKDPISCVGYLPSAERHGLHSLVDAVVDAFVAKIGALVNFGFVGFCAANMTGATLDSILNKIERSDRHSRIASRLVAEFCKKHEVGAEMFLSLTNAKVLPQIHPAATWGLLQKESELIGISPASLSNLQERCIDALAPEFRIINFSDKERLTVQSPLFLVTLMEKAQQHLAAEQVQ